MLLIDEILQIILNELDDPSNLSLTSKRLHAFTQDPYVRAHYFLSRYGRPQPLYWALGRGRLLNERVLDVRDSPQRHILSSPSMPTQILLSSGARLSRYLVQLALHHYTRTNVQFIKSRWVKTLSFPIFAYFLKVAGDYLGDVPVGKGEDDGSVFLLFVKENKLQASVKTVKTETMIEILDKYKVRRLYYPHPRFSPSDILFGASSFHSATRCVRLQNRLGGRV